MPEALAEVVKALIWLVAIIIGLIGGGYNIVEGLFVLQDDLRVISGGVLVIIFILWWLGNKKWEQE